MSSGEGLSGVNLRFDHSHYREFLHQYDSSDHPGPGTSTAPWRVYNIGNNRLVNLMDCIGALENALGKEANKEFLPIQPGDVPDTWANFDDLVQQFDYQPNTSVEHGVANFAAWFKDYYKK